MIKGSMSGSGKKNKVEGLYGGYRSMESEGVSPGMDASLKAAQRPGESDALRPAPDTIRTAGQRAVEAVTPGVGEVMGAVAPGSFVKDTGDSRYVYNVGQDGSVTFKSPISGKVIKLSKNETDPRRAKAYAAILDQVRSTNANIGAAENKAILDQSNADMAARKKASDEMGRF